MTPIYHTQEPIVGVSERPAPKHWLSLVLLSATLVVLPVLLKEL